MPIQDFLDRLTLTRRLVRALERQADAQEETTRLLARLADHFAPTVPEPSEEARRTAIPDYNRNDAFARQQDWLDGFLERHGRPPTDGEIDEWLAEDAERA